MVAHLPPGTGARDALRSAARWFDASPSELAGLTLLLLGSVAVTAVLWFRPPTTPSPEAGPVAVPTGHATVLVHVTGAVAQPGLVELPEGARIADAVALAGGVTADAAASGLNLARPVTDGEQIVVPARPEPGVGTQDGAGTDDATSAFRPDGRLDLNRATAADLEELPGIGPVLAERVIAWREEHGPFTEIGQLREVPGIGERTFQSLAELVTV